MAASRELRRRIKSTNSTKQITKAMELVSSAKMRRASLATLANRPYSNRLAEMAATIINSGEQALSHPLLTIGTAPTTLLIVIASDRGLAGAYTSNILKRTVRYINDQKAEGQSVECITIGKKSHSSLLSLLIPVIQNYPLPSKQATPEDLRALYNYALSAFTKGHFSKVEIIYTDFVSMLRQEPATKSLLPLSLKKHPTLTKKEFLYEPSPSEVLNSLLPYIVEVQLYQALLEALASEHSARRVAMKSATDNATSMADRLKLTYNRLRQGAITQEIAEITSGAAALEA